MFPLTITITNTDQLLRVMSALSIIETAHAVTTGVSAVLRAWRTITVGNGRPFAFAVRCAVS